MRFGVVFASTGGIKMARALRSLRRAEPDLQIHIVLDVASRTFKKSKEQHSFLDGISEENVHVMGFTNQFHINGCLNQGMRWMRDSGCEYACGFHDDVIFSPLPEHRGFLSRCFETVLADERLRNCPGISLPYVQAFSDEVRYSRMPEEWDRMDLESEDLWRRLLPNNGEPLDYWGEGGPPPKVQLAEFLAFYFTTRKILPQYRLGPPGYILPLKVWEEVGGFDENVGLFYDADYPAACALGGMSKELVIPGVPFIHLHNQSMNPDGDCADNLYGDFNAAFEKKYGMSLGDFTLKYFCNQKD